VGRERVDGLFVGFRRSGDSFRQGRWSLIAEVAAVAPAIIAVPILATTTKSTFRSIAAILGWSRAVPAITEIPAFSALAAASAKAALIAPASRATLAIAASVTATAFLGTGGRMVFPGRRRALAKLVDPRWHDLQAGQIDRRRSGGIFAHGWVSMKVSGKGLGADSIPRAGAGGN
jgi:hypothetical protein